MKDQQYAILAGILAVVLLTVALIIGAAGVKDILGLQSLSAGVFAIGIFSIGIFSIGVFNVGLFAVAVFTLGISIKRKSTASREADSSKSNPPAKAA